MSPVVTLLLSKLGIAAPWAKAIVPAAVGLVIAVVSALVTGDVNQAQIGELAAGLVASIVTYLVPNKPKVHPLAVIPPPTVGAAPPKPPTPPAA